MLRVDDRVVYNMDAGKISDIVSKDVAGIKMSFYQIYLYTKPDVKVFVPVNSTTSIRKISTEADVEEFIEKLKVPELIASPRNMHWKKAVRLKTEMANSKNFSERSDAYVHLRHRERLNPTEEELLGIIEDTLVYEISLILKKGTVEVKAMLDEAVLESRQGVQTSEN